MKKLYFILIIAGLVSFEMAAQSTHLTVRGFSEGYYQTATGKMNAVIDPVNQPLVCDSGTIEIIDVITNQTVMCSSSLISTDGYGEVDVPSSLSGMDYFISIKFKNTFHLLSATPVLMNGQPVTVDLTIPQNTCCNFDSAQGVAKAYSGDVNFDGAIDVIDMTLWENDYHHNPTGYHTTDVNGDRFVDTLDLIYITDHSNMGAADDYFSNCATSVFSGVSELDDQSFSVYPNPASTEINLVCNSCDGNKMQVSVLDMMGREVKNFGWEAGVLQMKVAIGELTPGIYMIRFDSAKNFDKTYRIVIE